jgi:hypothetical protein
MRCFLLILGGQLLSCFRIVRQPLQSPTVVKFLVTHKDTCNFLEDLESLMEARGVKFALSSKGFYVGICVLLDQLSNQSLPINLSSFDVEIFLRSARYPLATPHPTTFSFCQTYCLKMLVKSFLHQDSKGARTTKLKGLLNLLSKLISGNGQLVAGVEPRYAAGNLLLFWLVL